MPNEIMPNVFNSPFVKNTFTRLDNWINPIVVKEMRQAVRSRYIILLLQIYLALQALMTCSAFLLSDLTDLSDGKELFSMLTILLFLVNLCCVPVYTSNRLWKEVQQGDAMFTSTLTPLQIVRGKFFSGMTISLLLFSAAAPFVMLTYLMRGLDMSEILLSLYGLFLSIQVLNSMGIAFGTLKCSPLIRAILGFGCGITFIGILGNGPSGFFHLFSSMDVSGFIIATCLSLFLCEIFQLLATCILAPLSHNRMTRPRIFITASSILLVIISGIITILTSNDSFFNGCCTCIFFLVVLFLTVGLCERTTLSPRQIQQIPSNILLRIIYFPFFTGAGSAIAWFFTMMLFMYSFTYLFFCTLYSFGFGMSVENPFYLISTLVFIRYEGGIFYTLMMFFGYMTIGLIIRMLVDHWRRLELSQRISNQGMIPSSTSIVIYPTAQTGMATFLYAIILIAIVTIAPLFLSLSESKNWCLSPFYYIIGDIYIYGTSSPELEVTPIVFGVLSTLFLIPYSAYSFIEYCRLGNKNRLNR